MKYCEHVENLNTSSQTENKIYVQDLESIVEQLNHSLHSCKPSRLHLSIRMLLLLYQIKAVCLQVDYHQVQNNIALRHSIHPYRSHEITSEIC